MSTRAVAPALATGPRAAAPQLAPPGRRPARTCPGLPVAQTKRICSIHSQCARTAAVRTAAAPVVPVHRRARPLCARSLTCCPLRHPASARPLPVLSHVFLLFFFVVQSSLCASLMGSIKLYGNVSSEVRPTSTRGWFKVVPEFQWSDWPNSGNYLSYVTKRLKDWPSQGLSIDILY